MREHRRTRGHVLLSLGALAVLTANLACGTLPTSDPPAEAAQTEALSPAQKHTEHYLGTLMLRSTEIGTSMKQLSATLQIPALLADDRGRETLSGDCDNLEFLAHQLEQMTPAPPGYENAALTAKSAAKETSKLASELRHALRSPEYDLTSAMVAIRHLADDGLTLARWSQIHHP